MESDEIEMTKDEFRMWIRAKVEENKLIAAYLKEQYSLLQSLLEKREKQAIHLRKVCESVTTCEAIVKKQYALLGWEYRDTDLDDNDNDMTDYGNKRSELPEVKGRENLYRYGGRKIFIDPKRQPVVVLTRLTPHEISYFCRSKPQRDDSDVEYMGSSDMQWDSDFHHSRSSDNTQSRKRRQVCRMNEKPHAPPQDCGTSSSKRKATTKTPTGPADSIGNARIMRSAACQRSTKDNKTQDPHVRSDGEAAVGINVLCKRDGMAWHPGKITKILTNEDGNLKYKVHFEENVWSLVSGHHLAFHCTPKVDQLQVGARVVIKHEAEGSQFLPGILGEVPGRKNHMRFLVFLDDQRPVYVPLPALHVVCNPLKDPLDEIEDDDHRQFLRDYMKSWPYPPQFQYKIRQSIRAKLNGQLETCEVLKIDSSLIEVLFLKNQHVEWLYRGSSRLYHMISMKREFEAKQQARNSKV